MGLWELVRHRAVKRFLRRLISLARLAAPLRDHVVLYAWPQEEANGVVLVEHLGFRGIQVRWLVDDPGTDEVRDLLRRHPSVRARRRLSARGFVDYLTARVTFFTHGLYLSGASPRRKPVVNLWHGDGPKRNFMPRGEPPPRCDYVVSCSTVFGRSKAIFFEIPENDLLVTGNPRNDRFFVPPRLVNLREVGLRPDGFVVYMPTYRSARALGATVAWQDGETDTDPRIESLGHLVLATRAMGLDLVVKPHPLDSIGMDVAGARVLSDEDLAGAGLTTYGLLAASHSLVTDYSSIWTDYLSTGKHVGFAVPDWGSYAAGRGLESVSRIDLPGPVLGTADDVLAFLRAIEVNDPALLAQRDKAIETFGLVTAEGNCERLVAALAERGVRLTGAAP